MTRIDLAITVTTTSWHQAPAPFDDGHTLFAIGDVHGHAAHLSALHQAMRERIERTGDPTRTVVAWLGDFIDRGPDPLGVIDLVADGLGLPGVQEIRLFGNHELYLRQAVSAEGITDAVLGEWLGHGGTQTVQALVPDWNLNTDIGPALRQALGPERITFLHDLYPGVRMGAHYFLAHAGVSPERPLHQQTLDDLILIREPFLETLFWPFDVVVIHGHTPFGPSVRRHRIGVDSGVYDGGVLTAVEIVGEQMRFWHARSGEMVPEVDDRR